MIFMYGAYYIYIIKMKMSMNNHIYYIGYSISKDSNYTRPEFHETQLGAVRLRNAKERLLIAVLGGIDDKGKVEEGEKKAKRKLKSIGRCSMGDIVSVMKEFAKVYNVNWYKGETIS